MPTLVHVNDFRSLQCFGTPTSNLSSPADSDLGCFVGGNEKEVDAEEEVDEAVAEAQL